MSTVTMAFICICENLHVMAGILSLDNLYVSRETPFAGRGDAG